MGLRHPTRTHCHDDLHHVHGLLSLYRTIQIYFECISVVQNAKAIREYTAKTLTQPVNEMLFPETLTIAML